MAIKEHLHTFVRDGLPEVLDHHLVRILVVQLRPRDPATVACYRQAWRSGLRRSADNAYLDKLACCEAEPLEWCVGARCAVLDIEEKDAALGHTPVSVHYRPPAFLRRPPLACSTSLDQS